MERNIRNIHIVLRGPREESDYLYLWKSEKVSLGSQPGPGALKTESLGRQ